MQTTKTSGEIGSVDVSRTRTILIVVYAVLVLKRRSFGPGRLILWAVDSLGFSSGAAVVTYMKYLPSDQWLVWLLGQFNCRSSMNHSSELRFSSPRQPKRPLSLTLLSLLWLALAFPFSLWRHSIERREETNQSASIRIADQTKNNWRPAPTRALIPSFLKQRVRVNFLQSAGFAARSGFFRPRKCSLAYLYS